MSDAPSNRLWLGVLFTFALLLSAWGVFFYVASQNPVQEVHLQQSGEIKQAA